jgi:uncharacterized protein YbbK (DUF523 family)
MILKIGISSCLRGDRVRYDGTDKCSTRLHQFLGGSVEWVPVCPEVEVGMGVPREPVCLVGDLQDPHMVGKETGTDWTLQMLELCHLRVHEFKSLEVSGFVLKKASPSCGPDGVPVLSTTSGKETGSRGSGLLVRVLLQELPGFPVVDEDAVSTQSGATGFLKQASLYREKFFGDPGEV